MSLTHAYMAESRHIDEITYFGHLTDCAAVMVCGHVIGDSDDFPGDDDPTIPIRIGDDELPREETVIEKRKPLSGGYDRRTARRQQRD